MLSRALLLLLQGIFGHLPAAFLFWDCNVRGSPILGLSVSWGVLIQFGGLRIGVGKQEHGPFGSPDEAGPMTQSYTWRREVGCACTGQLWGPGGPRPDRFTASHRLLAVSTATLMKTQRAQRASFSDPLPLTGTGIKTRQVPSQVVFRHVPYEIMLFYSPRTGIGNIYALAKSSLPPVLWTQSYWNTALFVHLHII